MKPIYCLLLLALAACGAKNDRAVDFGKTTVAALVSEKGPPLEEKPIPVEDGKILVYDGNEKYQVKGEVVTHGFRDPAGDEKLLLYWKHKFKDCEPVERKLAEAQGHLPPEYELKCAAEGTSVIYTHGSEFVSRIIYHEKK
jgi:hypothetical protein